MQVLSWQPRALGTLADYLEAQARSIAAVSEQVRSDFDSVLDSEFSGEPREAGASQVRAASVAIAKDSVGVRRLSDALRTSAEEIEEAQQGLRSAIARAQTFGCAVDTVTGAVTIRIASSFRGEIARQDYHAHEIRRAFQKVIAEDARQAAVIRALAPVLKMVGAKRPAAEIPATTKTTSAATFEWAPGHSVTVFGDLDTAKTVITFVPGTGFRADDLSGQSSRIRALLHTSGERPEDTAVVLWHYDAPQSITRAASTEYYSDETAKLQNFQSALSERTVGKQVVVGYSYGSTLVAQATRGTGLHADQVLLVGSPGVGPGISSTKDMTLRRRDGSIYDTESTARRIGAATSRYDPIRLAAASGVHGQSPADEEFGAQTFQLWEPAQPPPFWSLPAYISSALRDQRRIEQIRAVGDAHTEHYFGEDTFTQQTRKWLNDN